MPDKPETKPEGWGRFLRRRVYFYGGLYLGVMLVLLWLENWFLFPATKADARWNAPPDGLSVEDVELATPDGTTVHAWWAEPEGWTPEKGAILYSHGNAGNLSDRGLSVKAYRDLGFAVLIYDYPGYGKSGGKPTEAGISAAGEAGYRWLTDVKKIPGERLLLYGGSLGAVVAIDLATRYPCRALVLVAAFTSFPDMAQVKFPIFPARWFVSNQMNNLARIANVRCPVFITHGTADTTTPYSMGERLFAAAPQPKYFLPQPGGGHNDGVGREFFQRLRAFLDEHAPLQ